MLTSGLRVSLSPWVPGLSRVFWCFGLALFSLSTRGAANPDWQSATGYRWTEQSVPTQGKTGFALLGPETGIAFTNRLSDALVARNRVLENGSGVALGDSDGDGWCDVYLCRLEGGNVLYRNRGDWRFEDVTETAGVACPDQFSTGAAFADGDGDGDLDLLVNSIGGGTRCFLNDGKGRFTELVGTRLVRRFGSTSMALADIDGDGDLDLYVTNYRTDTQKDSPPGLKVEARMVNGKVEVTPADRFVALATRGGAVEVVEKGERDFLYLNDGRGGFSPVSWTSGSFLDEDGKPLVEPPADWGLSVMFRDMNDDGTPDIYVCNDFFFSPDRIWINENGARFRAIARTSVRNMSASSMAADFADINRDGHDDVFVIEMLNRDHPSRQLHRENVVKKEWNLPIGDVNSRVEVPRNTLYLNRGDGTYAEIAQHSCLQASDWSWGVAFLDVDLDGYEDALVATGNNHDVQITDALRELAKLREPRTVENRLKDLRQFPRLETPKVAFRNQGDLTFKEVGQLWGFNTRNVSHGMAFADLDNDGDLDAIVNNLNAGAEIFRNDATAPRVAVRLKGLAPNTRGIGAKVWVYGGAAPVQSQEMICGGRYLSSDDAMRVFAAGGRTNEMRIEVRWRSGLRSVVKGVKANRIYEIDESAAESINRQPSTINPVKPLFEDVSGRIRHSHRDEPFDDFVRQPLLARRLSHLGPGVAWHDLDGDGRDDLIIAAGRNGRSAIFRNDGNGGFSPWTNPVLDQPVTRDQSAVIGMRSGQGRGVLLAGSSNYEAGAPGGPSVRQYDLESKTIDESIPGQPSSTGPLALADMDGDGDLDLFVGGRVVPGRYPEPASSKLFRNEGGKYVLDSGNSRIFEKVGLVSGAVFSDLDGDGKPELILACEWGPVRVFKNEGGKLVPWDMPVTINNQLSTINQMTGWWNGVTTGDFDGDGKLDIVASNWGTNTRYRCVRDEPLRIYYGDVDGNGELDVIEACFDKDVGKIVPWDALDEMSKALPFVRDRFTTCRAYGLAGVNEILGERFTQARELSVNTLEPAVFLNRGDRFEFRPLPVEAQLAPSFGVSVGDLDGDGNEDVFLSQNFFGVELQTSRYDAGRGLWLRGDGRGGFMAVPGQESGIKVYGEGRGCALADFDADGRLDLVVTQNGNETKLYRNVGARPGLRVRLAGPRDNPTAAGATIRLTFGSRLGAAREIHAGSGYWSQDSAVQVLATAERPAGIQVRWPGGRTDTFSIPPNTDDITVDSTGIVGA
ncbi:MAG TPA: VCBS repeat-containing protein, partial [Verrucomicrobiae bacterium]|nr:VCBS repeat-containing protein [Verrucomicrobiae bacterium]